MTSPPQQPRTIDRILVVRAGALGDTILTFPALHALRRCFPDARIEVVGNTSLWSLAAPLVDAVSSIEDPRYAALLSSHPRTEETVDADLLIIWSTRAPLSPAEGVIAITASPYPPPRVHAAAWLLSSLTPLGIDLALASLTGNLLALTAAEKEAGQAMLDTLGLRHPILIHPGAGAVWKRWPASRFAEVATRLSAAGHEVALVAGPADDEAVAEIGKTAQLPVLHDLPLRLFAGVLARSCLVLSNDSGVAHLAGAAGARTITLFGPTDPQSWTPLGDVQVIRHCPRRASEPGQVRICHDPACLERITVEEVLEAALSRLAPR